MALKFLGSLANPVYYGDFKDSENICNCDKSFWQATKIQHFEVPMVNSFLRPFGNEFTKWKYWGFALKRGFDTYVPGIAFYRQIYNFDDTSHDCVQIDFKCTKCGQEFEGPQNSDENSDENPNPNSTEFSLTYHIGRGGKQEHNKIFKKTLQCKQTQTINLTYSQIREVFDAMWNDYDLDLRNCKTWAQSFYLRLTCGNTESVLIWEWFDRASSLILPLLKDDTQKTLFTGAICLTKNFIQTATPEQQKTMIETIGKRLSPGVFKQYCDFHKKTSKLSSLVDEKFFLPIFCYFLKTHFEKEINDVLLDFHALFTTGKFRSLPALINGGYGHFSGIENIDKLSDENQEKIKKELIEKFKGVFQKISPFQNSVYEKCDKEIVVGFLADLMFSGKIEEKHFEILKKYSNVWDENFREFENEGIKSFIGANFFSQYYIACYEIISHNSHLHLENTAEDLKAKRITRIQAIEKLANFFVDSFKDVQSYLLFAFLPQPIVNMFHLD